MPRIRWEHGRECDEDHEEKREGHGVERALEDVEEDGRGQNGSV